MLTPRDQAAAVIRRAAHLSGCSVEDVLGRSRSPAADLARVKAYRALADDHGWSAVRIGRFFGRHPDPIRRVLKGARARGLTLRDPERTTPDDRVRERLEDLEVFVRRITGQQLAYQLRDRLQIPMWQALPLSIIVEAHPRVLTLEAICEQYEHAALALRFGKGQQVSTSLMKTAVSKIRGRFATLGLSDPVVAVQPHGLRLADDMAAWFEANFEREIVR